MSLLRLWFVPQLEIELCGDQILAGPFVSLARLLGKWA